MKNPVEKTVFVFIELLDGKVAEVSLELLGKAKELAGGIGGSVYAVLAGDGSICPYDILGKHGADAVVSAFHPSLASYMTMPYTSALEQLVKKYEPEIFLFGASAIGRDLAPRLSARLRTGLTADCTALEIDEESKHLMMTRPAFGGNLMATILCADHRPQMATVRPGVMQKNVNSSNAKPAVYNEDISIDDGDCKIEIIQTVMSPPSKQSIREAKVLVSGGRGMGSPESFDVLENIASSLGGTISSSRAAVDANWQPKDRQVGQTGQTVRPDLYIACGISGAIQHVAGMEESKLIIAVNKDESAPIFSVADLGIVGDVNTVLPALEKKLAKTAL